ncbi:hypothetical protein JI664_22635 [Rhodobacter sp. NTK016B]|uniref:hypothetical protein n=1 Tax=Rhodobacter sp. NTK016B TaxID=2759676 RepID=UPI001A8D8677|nr:hypothetical protein [Rhodobacter sp. NTK016B]MBN8294785.1 hypothetical protein [Rhodobacter sp. NTK016B]
MEGAILALIEWAGAQGPAWVLLLGALGGWWDSSRKARAREEALQERLLTLATDGTKQLFEALSTVREAMIHINRSGRG